MTKLAAIIGCLPPITLPCLFCKRESVPLGFRFPFSVTFTFQLENFHFPEALPLVALLIPYSRSPESEDVVV